MSITIKAEGLDRLVGALLDGGGGPKVVRALAELGAKFSRRHLDQAFEAGRGRKGIEESLFAIVVLEAAAKEMCTRPRGRTQVRSFIKSLDVGEGQEALRKIKTEGRVAGTEVESVYKWHLRRDLQEILDRGTPSATKRHVQKKKNRAHLGAQR